MQKARIGISVGLLAAIIYWLGLYGGYVITGILMGYVLLFEGNVWLRKNAVKAVFLMIAFSLISTVLGLIPNLFDILNSLLSIFGGSIYGNFLGTIASFFNNSMNFLSNIIYLLKSILFIVLGIRALAQASIPVPGVDNLINKYVG